MSILERPHAAADLFASVKFDWCLPWRPRRGHKLPEVFDPQQPPKSPLNLHVRGTDGFDESAAELLGK
eukprot:11789527-Prorocentrum_lima.AAC.1